MGGPIRGDFPRRGFRAPSTIPIVGETPLAILLDRLGREIQVGDTILLTNLKDTLPNWTVTAVEPIPAGPNVPPGALQFQVTTSFVLLAHGGRPDQHIALVQAAPEPEVAAVPPAAGPIGSALLGNDPANQPTDSPPVTLD